MSILAAIDGGQVPSSVLEIGYDLAQQYDEELVVVHVIPQDVFEKRQGARDEGDAPSFAHLPSGVAIPEQDEQTNYSESFDNDTSYSIQDGEVDAAAIAREVVEETLDGMHDVTVQGHVGEPVEEILDEAERMSARYLVIGGRKRSPVGKAVFGSVTQSVLLNADLPVMIVGVAQR